MSDAFLSVTLDADKCKGCINCIKRCPTQAIRVRNGKAFILSDRCIDCGECIRVCQNHAKVPVYDPLTVLDNYEYTVALPAPSLYGQFQNLDNVEVLLNGLLHMGFDDVFEVSKAAEIVSHCSRNLLESGHLESPIISSACPAIVRLIRIRFPELISHLLPLGAPVDVAAKLAVQRAIERTGLPREKIGIVFISPCAAKVTAMKSPLGLEQSDVDAVVAIKDVYPRLAASMRVVAREGNLKPLSLSGKMGVSWCNSGGESSALFGDNYIAADGMRNVLRVLEDLEDEKLSEAAFIELGACVSGCVGGILTVENPFIAQNRLKKIKHNLPETRTDDNEQTQCYLYHWDSPVRYEPILSLDPDYETALQKASDMQRILELLPGLDCGSCGAPTCEALAEDVVRGDAKETDCIFKMRDYVHALMQEMGKLESYIPPPFRNPE